MNFQAGEVVRLKSGGPKMTVIAIGDNGWLICNWFDKDQKQCSGSYPPHAVERD